MSASTTTAPTGSARIRGPVLIIGTGLLGASIGLALRAQGVEVLLEDISPSAQAVASDIGAGRPVMHDDAPRLVVVASPPDVVAQIAEDALTRFPYAVVLDIASVKADIAAALRSSGADVSRYVGTHPMAGREKSGPVAARGALFTSMPWVVCPMPESSAEARQVARDLGVALGANVTEMEAAEHDRTVALISHLPQVMSSMIASRLQDSEPHELALAGNGLRDVTRIAASDPRLWVQILAANAGEVVPLLHGVREDLNRLIATLEDPEAPGSRLDIAQLIDEGNIGQARIPGKHGVPPQSFAWLSVLVDDSPGQLARLLADIGEAGINLEDLRMGHSAGAPVGIVEVSVMPAREKELAGALAERGWKVVQ